MFLSSQPAKHSHSVAWCFKCFIEQTSGASELLAWLID
jgi:hypothetical protein